MRTFPLWFVFSTSKSMSAEFLVYPKNKNTKYTVWKLTIYEQDKRLTSKLYCVYFDLKNVKDYI